MQVEFSPKLNEESVREEALSLAIQRALEEEKLKAVAAEGVEVTAQSPDTKKRVKRHKSIATGQQQASPLASSITSLAAVSGGTPSSTTSAVGLHADSKDPVYRKTSFPIPEQGYVPLR